MTETQKLEKIGTDAVNRLRLSKLKSGNPFMINAKELPGNQCYLEFPDGRIQLVTISSSGTDFVLLRELSVSENADVRKRYQLA